MKNRRDIPFFDAGPAGVGQLRHGSVRLARQTHIPKRFTDRLAWLNLPSSKGAEVLAGRGLRRFKFHFTRDIARQRTFVVWKWKTEMR